MTNLYGLNSCFYDNCDKKKIVIKEKEGKRQGKKRMSDETRTWDLSPDYTDLPLGHEDSLAFTLQKAFI